MDPNIPTRFWDQADAPQNETNQSSTPIPRELKQEIITNILFIVITVVMTIAIIL